MQSPVDARALEVLSANRVAVFVVAYNAELHIEDVLARIPRWVAARLAEIYIIDDSSDDRTVLTATAVRWPDDLAPLRIFRTPSNQGYGGNQKIGYRYALRANFDIVVLLHGDGQYAPEALPAILAAFSDKTSAVFGSRFITRGGAIRGGMPLYKYYGNRILTSVQNRALNARLSEWHSGYRAYRTSLLRRIPFNRNSNGFEFDTEIIIQCLAGRHDIAEVAIPTYYGDEICRVEGIRYALKCLQAVFTYRLMQFEIFFDPKFDVQLGDAPAYRYTRKQARTSAQRFVRNLEWPADCRILDVGGGDGRAVAEDLAQKGHSVTCLDGVTSVGTRAFTHQTVDLDLPWHEQFEENRFEVALALDVLEHLKDPEEAIDKIARVTKSGGTLVASTGNVAFWPLRIMLFLGFFNYGRRGILDRTHRRLFTVSSFRRLFREAGFEVIASKGFGPPIEDLIGKSWSWICLDRICYFLATLCPGAFAYQIVLIGRKMPDLDSLVEKTIAFGDDDSILRPVDSTAIGRSFDIQSSD